MNRKILMSSSAILFVAALVITATGAFFSDTETSTGNTFTAGAIDLKVDSEQHYNGNVCSENSLGVYLWKGDSAYPVPGTPCDGSWRLTDLGNGVQKFWNFSDIKPGDEGENTISLHIDSNPAWACVDLNLTKNDDVSSVEPELSAGDTQNTDSIFDGELAQNIKFAAWADDGDNIWEVNEPLLFSNQSGPASDVLGGKTYKLADSTIGTPLPGGSTSYIGLAWCAGTQTVNMGSTTITCDGAGMGNNTQTDSMVADVTFRVEQARNNPNFVCKSVAPEPIVTKSLRLENENIVEGGPWTIISDTTFADLTWVGDGPTFDYTLNAQGLASSTSYSLIYYADGWPGNNPGAFIGSHTTNASGNIVGGVGNPNLGVDLPTLPDGNFAVGAKIWLVRSSDYNGGTLSTGPMTAWNPGQYLFEGNVYINYNDTDN